MGCGKLSLFKAEREAAQGILIPVHPKMRNMLGRIRLNLLYSRQSKQPSNLFIEVL
ncbi:hypothetical protein NIES19_20310 [Anabaena cylindrica PCC 7122]|nr:hypothetical protein NIES19_20310 [Anabaena cylindrica PCC 7122]